MFSLREERGSQTFQFSQKRTSEQVSFPQEGGITSEKVISQEGGITSEQVSFSQEGGITTRTTGQVSISQEG